MGRDRAAVGRALLAAHPDCNVILCDDGLQHYRLRRDRRNCWWWMGSADSAMARLLPAGPLREGLWRLHQVDAVVVNGGSALEGLAAQYQMHLNGDLLTNLRSGETRPAVELAGSEDCMPWPVLAIRSGFLIICTVWGWILTRMFFRITMLYRPSDLDWPDAEALVDD